MRSVLGRTYFLSEKNKLGYGLFYHFFGCEAVEYHTPEEIIHGKEGAKGLKELTEENLKDLEALERMVKK